MAITEAELSLYRGMVEDTLLTGTCTLQTRTWTADDMGGGSYTWSNSATGVRCRLVPQGLTSREEKSGGKIVVHDVFELSVPQDTQLTEEMRAIIGGAIYEVVHVDDVHTEKITVSADVVRVR